LTIRYLLDTSVLSAVIAPKPSRPVLQRLGQRGIQCATASVVWNELSYGCERLEPGKRKIELEAYLRDVVLKSFPILPYDQEAATWHAFERVRQERVGRPGPYIDGQIAAIACVHDLILVTGNVKDFTRFKGLTVEDWTTPTRSKK
jgi:tRNA(fMet)-specific endonuclease VapC